jgi:uncharacterized membrane-anchored protein
VSKNNLRQSCLAVALAVCFSVHAAEPAQPEPKPEFAWVVSPSEGQIAQHAHIRLEGDLGFLDAAETRKFLQATGNLPSDNSYTLANKEQGWFAIFDFVADGYVKDDEKIDPDGLLSVLQENNKAGMEKRKQQNLGLLFLDGWHTPPHYDSQTKRLEWAIMLHDEQNNKVVNFTTRLLGRHGYMSATLVSDPKNLDRDIASFKTALKGYDFNDGERYSEFRSGDKVAAYGLGALVLGGAAAAVASKGGFKAIAYAAVAAAAAAWGFIKRMFGKKN